VRGDRWVNRVEDLDLLDAGEDIVETVARNQELETLTIPVYRIPAERTWELRSSYRF